MADSADVSGRRLVRNTAVNAMGSVVLSLVAVAVTPVLLRSMGPSEYGVWVLATSLTFATGYLALADLGVQQGLVRYIAEARQRQDDQGASEVTSTALACLAVIGAVGGALIVVAAPALARSFALHGREIELARVAFAIIGVQLAVDLPASVGLGIIEGAQRYGTLRAVEVAGRVGWSLAAAFAAVQGKGPVALASLSVVAAVVAAGGAAVAAHNVQPGLRVRLSLVHPRVLRELLAFSAPMMGLRVLSVVYRQVDRLAIGLLLSAVAVARYDVIYKLHVAAATVLAIAPSALTPAAAYLGAAQDRQRLRLLYLRGSRYAVALSLPVTLAVAVHADQLITSWVGVQYRDLAGAARLFLAYPAMTSVHTIGITMLVGLGRMRDLLRLNVVAAILNVTLTVVLVPRLGISGAVAGTLAGNLFLWLPYWRIVLTEFDLELREVVMEVLAPLVPVLVVEVAVAVALHRTVAGRPGVLVLVAISLEIGVALGLVVLGIGPEQRSALLSTLRRTSTLSG